MQTTFTPTQLADPANAASEKIIRTCVHCGFCTATCPTYVLLGDERDSPRGRIYLIKDMLENNRKPSAEVVKHIDRCLSCLSCMTTCPSGVHYGHLVDHARAHIQETYRRPLADRLMRQILAKVMPSRRLFRSAAALAVLGRPFGAWFRRVSALKPLAAMLELAPRRLPAASPGGRRVHPAAGERRGRVALLRGCVQSVLEPGINEAAIRLLNRAGLDVVEADEGCCGSLLHHMGREEPALAQARAAIDAWTREAEGGGLDAIVITASGCGATIKDYAFMLRGDPAYADKAARISSLAGDVTEILDRFGLPEPVRPTGLSVAYHAACSLQHGQKLRTGPKRLLEAAGFVVKDVPEGHLCCGSAGTYNILQSEIAERLRDRKLANIARTAPQVVATGNIGCMAQLGGRAGVPVMHTVELLDWASGGPAPAGLDEAIH